MNLREAAQQALDVMEDTRWAVADQAPNEDVAAHDKAMNTLRAALAEDAMQRLTDEQQMIESHIGDDNKMVATINETETVEPVAYVTGYSKGRCIIEAVDPDWLLPVGMALYRSPPTINEMETVEPVAYSYTDARGRTVLVSTNTAPYEDAKPLYSAPPQRKPLTEDQLIEAYCCVNDQEWAIGGMTDARIFARAIERAHGIGGEE